MLLNPVVSVFTTKCTIPVSYKIRSYINSPEVDMINFLHSESIDIMKKYSIDPKQMADYVNNCSTSERDL